jgi:hypothetical protein
MTDELKRDGNTDSEPYDIGGEDMAREEERFLHAVKRALDAEAERVKLHTSDSSSALGEFGDSGALILKLLPGLKKALVSAAAILLCLSIWFLLARPITTVQATSYAGVTGVVTNGITLRAQRGVQFKRVDSDGKEQEFFESDANGIYTLPAPRQANGDSYNIEFQGMHLGSLNVGPAADQVSGYVQINAPIPAEYLSKSVTVRLEPGETQEEILPGLSIALSATATSAWEGSVNLNTKWPANFTYGLVLDGVWSITGPACQDLELSYRTDTDRVSQLGGTDSDLELITYSEAYRNPASEYCGNSGMYGGSDPGFHLGWYVTDEPLSALPHGPHLNVTQDDVNIIARWSPRADEPYALLLRQNPGGTAVAAWLSTRVPGSSDRQVSPVIGVFGQDYPSHGMIYVSYVTESGETVEMGPYPDIYSSYKPVWDNRVATWRELGDLRGEAFLPDGEFGKFSGRFQVSSVDFTMTNAYKYDLVAADFSKAPPAVSLEVEQHGIGSQVTMKLSGELPPLAKRIEWDLGQDGRIDGYDDSYEFPISHIGSYRISAIITPREGPCIVLEESINITPEGILGLTASPAVDSLVIEGSALPPTQESTIRFISVNSMPRPANLAYMTSQYAGPAMYVEVPPEFCDTPLKEARVILFGSPRGGDYQEFFVSPYMYLTGECDFSQPYAFSGSLSADLADPFVWVGYAKARSFDCFMALRRHDRDPANGARSYFTALVQQGQGEETLLSIKRVLGIDAENLPSELELVSKLQDFRSSQYYCQIPIVREQQEVRLFSQLYGNSIPLEAPGVMIQAVGETRNILLTAQWDLYSGPEHPARVEFETEDGRTLTRYFDYTGLQETSEIMLKLENDSDN